MSQRLYSLVAKVMNVSVSQITDNSGPASIDSWTSFKGYVLLYELEEEFKTKFTIDEALDVKTVTDIKRHLKNHGIVLND
jgi:acyl carrier protein